MRITRSALGAAATAIVTVSLLAVTLVAGHQYALREAAGGAGADFATTPGAALTHAPYAEAEGVVTGTFTTFHEDATHATLTRLDLARGNDAPLRLLDALVLSPSDGGAGAILGAHYLLETPAARALVTDSPAASVEIAASQPTTVTLTLPAGATLDASGATAVVHYAGAHATLAVRADGGTLARGGGSADGRTLVAQLAAGQSLTLRAGERGWVEPAA